MAARADSPIYKAVQREMIEMTKPVALFLTNLAREKAEDGISQPLAMALSDAKFQQVPDL